MIADRIVIGLARHPMVVVIVLLTLIGVLTAAGAQALLVRPDSRPAASTREAGVALHTLPTPRQHPPQEQVDHAHAALHALGRACNQPMVSREPEQVRAALDIIDRFATDYPNGGFSMDGEPASTLALTVVVFEALKSCDPAYLPEIERHVPAKYRGN